MIDHLTLNGREQNQRAITTHFLSLSEDRLADIEGRHFEDIHAEHPFIFTFGSRVVLFP